jgi:hypothetical protein
VALADDPQRDYGGVENFGRRRPAGSAGRAAGAMGAPVQVNINIGSPAPTVVIDAEAVRVQEDE